jgi:hypothetical protein
MARIANPNRLLVEGLEELRVITHFMDHLRGLSLPEGR